MKYILIIISTALLSGCLEDFADHAYAIKIKNNSNQVIVVYANYILPDTLLSLEKPRFIELQPTKTRELFGTSVNDPELHRFESEKLTIFVLSKDIVDRYSWEEIRSGYKILKRFEINEQDLVNMGGSVIFP
jgi:hypothetical protein